MIAPLVALVVFACAGAYVLFSHPLLPFRLFAFFLGAGPLVLLPGFGVPVIFFLAAAMWGSMLTGRWGWREPSWADGLALLLILVAGFSVLGNGLSNPALQEFLRWALLTSLVYPLLALTTSELALVGKVFVAGTLVAAGGGLMLLLTDPEGSRLSSLSFLGYDPAGGNTRVVLGQGEATLRLTASYVDPNLAGLMLTFGLVLAVALLPGRWLVPVAVVLLAAIALTLSRAALGSIVIAGGLFVFASRTPLSLRRRLASAGALSFLGLMLLPAIRGRLLSSFGSSDTGSKERWKAVEEFPSQMSGNWILGNGWGLPELVSGQGARLASYVANTPLLTVYRGGVVVGAVFALLLLISIKHAWRLLREERVAPAALGAGFLGVALVALQLDFPVVTLAPATAGFALCLAFLGTWSTSEVARHG